MSGSWIILHDKDNTVNYIFLYTLKVVKDFSVALVDMKGSLPDNFTW